MAVYDDDLDGPAYLTRKLAQQMRDAWTAQTDAAWLGSALVDAARIQAPEPIEMVKDRLRDYGIVVPPPESIDAAEIERLKRDFRERCGRERWTDASHAAP